MRIGIMLRSYEEKGGVGIYARNVTRHLLRHAGEHELFLYFRNPDSVGAYEEFPNANARCVSGGTKFLWDQVQMPRWFRRDRLDVLFHPKFTVPLLCARRSVMVLHGAGWFIPETRHFWTRTTRLYARLMMPVYCRLAGSVLSVSEITRDVFIDRLGVSPDKIVTVYFAPGEQFNVEPGDGERAAITAKYRLPERYILTLSGGDRADRKNFSAILDSFRRVHEQFPCALVVAGRGCEDFRKRYDIPDGGWGSDVHFTGWVDQHELPVLYRQAAVFLYPSNMEAFPIPVTEALASGTPIVTSNAYGLKELAGDAALLVDPGSPADIAAAVLRLLREPSLREALASTAAVRAKLFDWDECASRTLGILEDVGGRHGGS
jgi:glycosyltransferase involved in cell wall biosynthesis